MSFCCAQAFEVCGKAPSTSYLFSKNEGFWIKEMADRDEVDGKGRTSCTVGKTERSLCIKIALPRSTAACNQIAIEIFH